MKALVIGTLGKDVECVADNTLFRITGSIAENQRTKDGQIITNWYNILYYAKSNKVCEYLKKGCKIAVWGECTIETYRSEQTLNVNVSRSIFVKDMDILTFPVKDVVANPEPVQQNAVANPEPVQSNAAQQSNGNLPF